MWLEDNHESCFLPILSHQRHYFRKNKINYNNNNNKNTGWSGSLFETNSRNIVKLFSLFIS